MFKHHDPLRFSLEQLQDLVSVSHQWFQQAAAHQAQQDAALGLPHRQLHPLVGGEGSPFLTCIQWPGGNSFECVACLWVLLLQPHLPPRPRPWLSLQFVWNCLPRGGASQVRGWLAAGHFCMCMCVCMYIMLPLFWQSNTHMLSCPSCSTTATPRSCWQTRPSPPSSRRPSQWLATTSRTAPTAVGTTRYRTAQLEGTCPSAPASACSCPPAQAPLWPSLVPLLVTCVSCVQDVLAAHEDVGLLLREGSQGDFAFAFASLAPWKVRLGGAARGGAATGRAPLHTHHERGRTGSCISATWQVGCAQPPHTQASICCRTWRSVYTAAAWTAPPSSASSTPRCGP